MDSPIRNSQLLLLSNVLFLILHTLSPTPMLKINRSSGFVFLTRLRVGFSHLRKHKFRHDIFDISDTICFCHFNAVEILNITFCIAVISLTFETRIKRGHLASFSLLRMLLFGNPKICDNANSGIIYVVIKFFDSTNRFSGSIYD